MTEPLLLALTTVDRGVRDCVTARGLKTRIGDAESRQGRALRRLGVVRASRASRATKRGRSRSARWPRRRGRAGGAAQPLDARCATSAAIALYPAVADRRLRHLQPRRRRRVVRRRATSSCPRTRRSAIRSLAAAEIGWGTRQLSGGIAGRRSAAPAPRSLLVVGVVMPPARDRAHSRSRCAARRRFRGRRFCDGHPFRIRYMVPLIAIEAIGAGASPGWRRTRARPRSAPSAADRAARGRRRTSCGRSTRRRRWWSRRSGIGRTRRCARRSPRASRSRVAARRSWRAWDRSATTCRNVARRASRSATSCTKATATSGSPRSKTRGRSPAGC